MADDMAPENGLRPKHRRVRLVHVCDCMPTRIVADRGTIVCAHCGEPLREEVRDARE